jgi:hypothetical protein
MIRRFLRDTDVLNLVDAYPDTGTFAQEADGGGTEGMRRNQSCNFFENPVVNLLYEKVT